MLAGCVTKSPPSASILVNELGPVSVSVTTQLWQNGPDSYSDVEFSFYHLSGKPFHLASQSFAPLENPEGLQTFLWFRVDGSDAVNAAGMRLLDPSGVEVIDHYPSYVKCHSVSSASTAYCQLNFVDLAQSDDGSYRSFSLKTGVYKLEIRYTNGSRRGSRIPVTN